MLLLCAWTVGYKFANKPHSLLHWLEVLGGGTMRDADGGDGEWVGGTEEDDNVVIVSVDPDFIFLKPFR